MVKKKLINFFKYYLLNEISNFEPKKKIKDRMRGFAILNKRVNKTALSLKKELTLYKIKSILRESKFLLDIYFGKTVEDKELLIRQFLLIRFGYFNFNRSLFCSQGTKKKLFVHPIPKDWYSLIEKYDLKINKFKSSILFFINQITHFLIGIFSLLKIIYYNIFSSNIFFKKSYSLFYNILNSESFPEHKEKLNKNDSFTLIDWYLKLDRTSNFNIKNILHNKSGVRNMNYENKNIIKIENIFPKLHLFNFLLFFLHSFFLIFVSFFGIIFGKWYLPILLKDVILRAYVKYCDEKLMAKQYLFDNSNFIYRPLWTYEAEKKGSEIVCYFFSTNCREIEKDKTDSSIGWGYRAMDWPIYYVWDEYQKKFIKELNLKLKNIYIYGPVYFLDKNILPNLDSNNSITIFDIQPRRTSVLRNRIEPIYYYNTKNICKFIEDIFEVSRKLNFKIVLKQKRKENSEVHIKYRNLIKKISKFDNVSIVDQNISPMRLIKNTKLSLSIPFTSSSLYAAKLNKKTAYYDPISILSKNNIASHGQLVITSKIELENWIKNYL